MKILVFIFFINFFSANFALAQDEFKFNLETLKDFLPENKFDTKNPKILNLSNLAKEDKKEIIIFKYYDGIYPLTINAQIINEEITDIYVRFPNNFPHDVVLFNIREKINKHDRKYQQGRNILLTWVEKEILGKKIEVIYHGSCSLTCFPVGLYLISKKAQKDPSFISLYQKFNKDFPKGVY